MEYMFVLKEKYKFQKSKKLEEIKETGFNFSVHLWGVYVNLK